MTDWSLGHMNTCIKLSWCPQQLHCLISRHDLVFSEYFWLFSSADERKPGDQFRHILEDYEQLTHKWLGIYGEDHTPRYGREGRKREVDGEGLSKLLPGGHQGGFIQKLAFCEARVGKISFGKLSRGNGCHSWWMCVCERERRKMSGKVNRCNHSIPLNSISWLL